MKFKSKYTADQWRKRQPFASSHRSIKTRYWSLTENVWVACWTVVYAP